MDLSLIRRKTNKLVAEKTFAEKQVVLERQALRDAKEKLRTGLEVQKILQLNAEALQNKAQQEISPIVTRCLKTVFGSKSYEFKIDFRRTKNKTEARLVFIKDGEEFDPKEESGGGAIDIAAFALRLTCLLRSVPKLRRVLILDEPFKWVNGELYQARIAELLPMLAEEKGVQMIITTDDEWLKIGRVVDLGEMDEHV